MRLMRNITLFATLVFLLTGSTLSTVAQDKTYFWVGENNYWNNPQAWSLSPGGPPVGQIPDQNTNVVIEPNSDAVAVIQISGGSVCADLVIAGGCELECLNPTNAQVFGELKITEPITMTGPLDFYFYTTEPESAWDSGNSIFPGNVSFLGNGGFDVKSHILTQHQEISIASDSFDLNGHYVTSASFQMPSSTSIDVTGSTIYVTNEMNVASSVLVTQDGDNVLISEGIEDTIIPGAFDIEFAQNRTATCGTGAGETAFTITASVISDYNGFDVSCNGAEDGEAFVTVVGGVGPFSFQWIGGPAMGFSQNYPNLGAGTYTVLVTDEGQALPPCVDNVQITEPGAIALFSFDYTPPSCDGECDGVGVPVVIGGVPGYDFDWTTGETTQVATQLCEGSNTLVVEDQNSCVFDTTFTIELQPVFANVDITNILCGGTPTGSAVSTPSGGAGGPYSWSWSTGDTDNDITGQLAGSYTLTVTDAVGCSTDTTFTINEEPPLTITLDDLQDVSCGGLTDGSIEITINGGLAPLSISWAGSNGYASSDEDIFGLEDGDYDVAVTDANLCVTAASYMISAPPIIVLDFAVTDITCIGADDGEIDLEISGGTPDYSVAWTGPNEFISVDEDISGLEPGTYEVIVTDANDCIMLGSADVQEPDPIDASPDITPIACNGADDAAIDLTISGGTPGYSTDWTGPNGFSSTDEDISGLEPGDYDVIITDANGCQTPLTITIDDTPAIEATFDVIEITCAGADDGAIDPTISGGTPPYSTSWTADNGFTSTDENISGLAPGQYELTITDDAGCFVVHEVILNEPLAITILDNVIDVSCGGLFDGEIDVSILGGAPDYTFDWTGPNGFTSTDEDLTALEAGDYDLIVTDDAGCQETATITVDQPAILEATLDVTPISCNGADDGGIDLTIIGGQPPYIIDWTGPNGFSSTDEDISDLEAGTYLLYVEDQNGCFVEAQADLDEPDAIDVTVDTVDPTCFGEDTGSITLTLAGGVEPYDILWNTGDATDSLIDLTAGDYDVTITDVAGCQVVIDPITLNEPSQITLDFDVTDIQCGGNSNGSIDLTISGGTPGYTVSWTGPNGFTSSDTSLSDLEAGDYDVTANDAAGCIQMGSVEITEPTELELDGFVTPILCNGDLGAIDIMVTGGVAPFTIVWSSVDGFSSNDEDITDIPADVYAVEVTDDSGCFATMDFDLSEPDEIQVDVVVTNLDCSGVDNGSIEIEISGGTPPYIVGWVGPSFASGNEDIFDLAEGTYTLAIMDMMGCTFTAGYDISQPEMIDVSADISSPLCAGDLTGSIDITVTGGVPEFTFLWTGPNGFSSPSEDISNLEHGTYDLHIEDSGSCVFDASYEITSTPELILDTSVTPVGCAGEATGTIDLTINGGTPGYNVSWSGPNNFSSSDEDIADLEAGDYTVTVTDANLCFTEATVTLDDGADVTITTNTIDSTCGFASGEAWVSIDGAVDPVVITWQDESMAVIGTDTLVTDLGAGQYSVSVTDANGCGGVFDVTISDTDVADLDANITDVLCFGDSNGAIDLTISNGTEPYTFTWSGANGFSSSDEDIADLEAGDYTLNIVDGVGCEINEVYTVNSPEELTVAGDVTDIYCNGENTGEIDITIVGGTEPYDIVWTGPSGFSSTDEDLTGLEQGTYDVTFTDANLCIISASFEVIESDQLGIDITTSGPLCFGETGGQIDIMVMGGTLPYDFAWTGPNGFNSTNEDIIDLEAGDYTLALIDDLGCALDTTITILENPEIVIDLDVVSPACLQTNGSIEAIVTGGTVAGDYAYFWYDISNGGALISTDALIEDLSSGEFYLEVFDDLGCMAMLNYTLTDADGMVEGSIQDVLCFDGNTGTIDITMNGGNPDFTYEWEGPGGFTSADEDLADLEAGAYEVIVTDTLGCLYGEVFEVLQPDSIMVTFLGGNLSCPGEADADLLTTITGGTPNYSVSWTGPDGFMASTENLSDLAAGCYTIDIVDANLCTAQDEFCVLEPEELALDATFINIDCYADTTGSIVLDVTGGTPFYTFNWVGPDGFTSSDEDLFALGAGQYDLQLTDQNGCALDTSFVLLQNDSLSVIQFLTNPGCPGDSNGAIALDVSGGTPGYQFDWSSVGGFTSTDEDIADLSADMYTLTVTDALSCEYVHDIELADPDSLDVEAIVQDISCFGEEDGMIDITILGGSAPYSVDWTGPNLFMSSDEDISDLEQGSYQLIIQDLYLCSDTFQYQITEPEEFDLVLDNLTNTSCPDTFDGGIEVSTVGGSPTITFDWSGPDGFISDDEDIVSVGIGTYNVLATDSNGCQAALNDIPLINLGDVTVTAPEHLTDCFGNGEWTLVGENVGGQTDAWFDLDGNEITAGSNLVIDPEPGTYEFIYQAIDGPCVKQDTVEVVIWELPEADAGMNQDIFLEEPVTLGGDPTADFENDVAWNPAVSLDDSTLFNPTAMGLTMETQFIVTVTDLNGCTAMDSVLITIIPEVIIPSGFTPNGDGQNDGWALGNVDFYTSMEVEIYNRWGDLLWRNVGGYEPWDGYYDNQPLPIGTYYYVINLNEPEFPEAITGPITILR